MASSLWNIAEQLDFIFYDLLVFIDFQSVITGSVICFCSVGGMS